MPERETERERERDNRPIPRGGRRRGEGRGANAAPEPALLPNCKQAPSFWQRPPESLDGWHPPGGSRLEASSPEQTQGAPGQRGRKLRLGPWRGWGAPHPGRERPSSSWPPELLGRGRHRAQAQLSPRFCGGPKNGNRTPGRARSLESSLEPEQCSTRAVSGANPVWPGHCEGSPHRPVAFLCSAPPAPQHHWTSEPEQETPPPACARAEMRHWRDDRSQINKGTRFRRDRCNRLNPCS